MTRFLTQFFVGVALLATSAVAQTRTETVQHTPANGMTCTVVGAQGGADTLVLYEPRIGGFSFGYSSVFIEPHLSSATLSYTSYGLDHKVTPQFVWGAWVVGLGTVTYTVL